MYEILVDDNFHFMDEDERHTFGNFPTLEMALDACREIVTAPWSTYTGQA
jgi:hypothetical protein